YKEPKGVFLLEAMGCGVPVVQPRHGAFPEIIGKTAGGILVEPDDSKALAEGLYRLLKEPGLAEQLGANGFQGVRRHYNIERSADHALQVYELAARNKQSMSIARQTEQPADRKQVAQVQI